MDEGIGSKSTSTADNDNRSGAGDEDSSTKATEENETPMELDDTSNELSDCEQKKDKVHQGEKKQ